MSNTDQDTTPVRERVAEHVLIDANGAPVDAEELATGIRYIRKGAARPFEFQSGLPAGERNTMLVCFGAKTLATNESSQVRNNPKGAGTIEDEMDAIDQRFADLESGKWVDRTRDGVGARVDKDKLAQAVCNVLVAGGKKTQADVDGGYLAQVRAKLESDKTFQATARNVPGVNEEYSKLMGRITKTLDDLVV